VKKTALILGIILTALLWVRAGAQPSAEEKLFQEAKILLFDEKWEEAQEKLEAFLQDYPSSPLVCQAVFYRAKCLGRQRGKQKEALEAYEDYLRCKDKNTSLVEEAETSIIDLAYDLYNRGAKQYGEEIEARLKSSNRVIRYYAAFKLSLVNDKQIASRAIPVLKEIIAKEKDFDLQDRAKIALLRISPDALKEVERGEEERRVRILKIRVYVRGQKEPELSLNIPWALADLALSAIPEKDRSALRSEGYDLDKIIDQLTRTRGSIIEIREKERTIKIWIDRE
jgi:tetratricopeptide (TPR) repeat protein